MPVNTNGFGPPLPQLTNPPPNSVKFATNSFAVLDTNYVAATDARLYNAVLSCPPDTNPAAAYLQIMQYTTNSIIIKAHHFNYSTETSDFALLIVDQPGRPTWKNVDLAGSSDGQDGWLIQGSVPAFAVTDPLFMVVSNLNSSSSVFFRVIPYGGPQLQISGAQQGQEVSGVLPLQIAISDLSGTTSTNQATSLTVNGLAARYTSSAGNMINLDTHYAPNGSEEVEFSMGTLPVTCDSTNLPMDTKLLWGATAALSLDFQNTAFLVNAGDMCPPQVGTNYITFGVSQADTVSATISDPSSGVILARYAGSLPGAGTFVLAWNFTESDGVTPYTNDTYLVQFSATDPASLAMTNTIDVQGVRPGAGTMISYAVEQTTNDVNGANAWSNGQAYNWIDQTLTFLYNDIYDQLGLTEYDWGDVGIGRNLTTLAADYWYRTGWRTNWVQPSLGSMFYSDGTFGPFHGNATAFGSGGAKGETVATKDILAWAQRAGPNWRLRKAAVWSCFSGQSLIMPIAPSVPRFDQAFGIRPAPQQNSTNMRKNAGLFWAGSLGDSPTNGFSIAQAEETFDEFWVCGQNPWPGACNPTWAIYRPLQWTLQVYPSLTKFQPVLAGFYWLPYSSIYDNEIMTNNLTNISQ